MPKVKETLKKIEKKLEKDAGLISEAIADVVVISRLNTEDQARKIIAEQYVIINRQDLEEL